MAELDFQAGTRRMVKRYAEIKGYKIGYVWGKLYGEIKTRLGIDVYEKRRTSHVRMKPIQVLSVYDIWDKVYDIAKCVFR